jgi:hypothetical protein
VASICLQARFINSDTTTASSKRENGAFRVSFLTGARTLSFFNARLPAAPLPLMHWCPVTHSFGHVRRSLLYDFEASTAVPGHVPLSCRDLTHWQVSHLRVMAPGADPPAAALRSLDNIWLVELPAIAAHHLYSPP